MNSFFFYDLETSGINPRSDRIMQFAGQRTDEQLKPIGKPYNFLIKLSGDVLPDPGAILITGITPQMTLTDGITEAEFFKIFMNDIAVAGTTFVGFNNIRFDDEFMRYGLYRNFYDPYQWQWKDGCSRWDILDIVRLTRALRPGDIKWPFASDGKPTNRLELLTSLNNIDHNSAHDALSDVNATIAVAKMIRDEQPKLFDYLYGLRSKRDVERFVGANPKFVYVSGRYSNDNQKMTVVAPLGSDSKNQGAYVYDLRVNPDKYLKMSPEQLAKEWQPEDRSQAEYFPIKVMAFNKCPSIAPMGVLASDDQKRLKIDMGEINDNLAKLVSAEGFYQSVVKAQEITNRKYQTEMITDEFNVDSTLYNSFIGDADRRVSEEITKSSPDNLVGYEYKLGDPRLKILLPLYKARNYYKDLSPDELANWEKYCSIKLKNTLSKFSEQFNYASNRQGLSSNDQYLLEEIKLYAESLIGE